LGQPADLSATLAALLQHRNDAYKKLFLKCGERKLTLTQKHVLRIKPTMQAVM